MRLRTVSGACFAVGSAMLAGWAWGGIEGSKHDFSREAWSGGDECAACHTPQSNEPPTVAPLWDSNADLARTFGTSLSQSNNAGLGTVMCIRCHDGTIARDTFTATGRERFEGQQNPGLFQGGHNTSNHPVGVDYPTFDRGYRPAPSVIASGTVVLPDGKVECISCHDPHDMSAEKYMLVRSNARSALCLTCHRK